MCVREGQREREGVYVCVYVCVHVHARTRYTDMNRNRISNMLKPKKVFTKKKIFRRKKKNLLFLYGPF